MALQINILARQNMYWLMAALMGIGIIATLLAQEPETAVKPPRTLYEAVIEPLYEFSLVIMHG